MHLVLVLYIQKNYKTVYIYVFGLFFSEIVVKIDQVFMLGNYIRISVCVRPTVSILAGCVILSET